MIETTWKFIDRFDRIERKAKRAKSRVMRRSGGIVRSLMRRSIRYRKKTNSDPGSKPFAHVPSSSFGLRMILWHYDPKTETTIIGPVGGSENTGGPHALEHGGTAKIRMRPRDQKKYGRKYSSGHVAKREFAYPALEKFSSSYPDLWKDSIQ